MKRVWVCFLEQGVASGGLDYNSLLRANFAAVPHSIPVIALAFVYQVEGQNSNCFNVFALQVVYFKRLPCTFKLFRTLSVREAQSGPCHPQKPVPWATYLLPVLAKWVKSDPISFKNILQAHFSNWLNTSMLLKIWVQIHTEYIDTQCYIWLYCYFFLDIMHEIKLKPNSIKNMIWRIGEACKDCVDWAPWSFKGYEEDYWGPISQVELFSWFWTSTLWKLHSTL